MPGSRHARNVTLSGSENAQRDQCVIRLSGGVIVGRVFTGKATLEDFAEGPWGRKYPAIVQSWRRNWTEVIPFFAFPEEVRRMIYTTNAIEALNAKLRRAVRARGHFPTDEAALKLLFLVLNMAQKEWRMSAREWGMAKAQFAILFEGRFRLA